MEKRTLDQARELVNNSFPTIFSKEDVINLLGSIEIPEAGEETPKGKFFLSGDQIASLAEKISSRMEDNAYDIIDSDDADFDIEIGNIAQSAIQDFINELNEENEED